MTSDQREDDKGRCIIHVSWSTPPSAALEDVTHFNISINETTEITEPYDSTRNLALSAHLVCSCGDHRVSIIAINRCGGASRRTGTIIPDRKPMLESESCYASTTQSSGDGNGGSQTQSRACSYTEDYKCKFHD